MGRKTMTCGRDNADGTSCSRRVGPGARACHIHRGGRAGAGAALGDAAAVGTRLANTDPFLSGNRNDRHEEATAHGPGWQVTSGRYGDGREFEEARFGDDLYVMVDGKWMVGDGRGGFAEGEPARWPDERIERERAAIGGATASAFGMTWAKVAADQWVPFQGLREDDLTAPWDKPVTPVQNADNREFATGTMWLLAKVPGADRLLTGEDLSDADVAGGTAQLTAVADHLRRRWETTRPDGYSPFRHAVVNDPGARADQAAMRTDLDIAMGDVGSQHDLDRVNDAAKRAADGIGALVLQSLADRNSSRWHEASTPDAMRYELGTAMGRPPTVEEMGSYRFRLARANGQTPGLLNLVKDLLPVG